MIEGLVCKTLGAYGAVSSSRSPLNQLSVSNSHVIGVGALVPAHPSTQHRTQGPEERECVFFEEFSCGPQFDSSPSLSSAILSFKGVTGARRANMTLESLSVKAGLGADANGHAFIEHGS